MRISHHDKLLLFEMEFASLVFIIILSFLFYAYRGRALFYIITLIAGFILYFWMLLEENVHKTGKQHAYFEYTSSYIIMGQAALALGLLSYYFQVQFLIIVLLAISVIMYSISLSRILLFKIVFPR